MNAVTEAHALNMLEHALSLQWLAAVDAHTANYDSLTIEEQLYWQDWSAHSSKCARLARDNWLTWSE